MKVAILGAGGLLGTHLHEELGKAGHTVVALDRARCDLGVRAQVIEATAGVEAIVNCGAYTNVDGAEKEIDAAYRSNALGSENAAWAGRTHGALCVQISTDFVFDGEKAPYDELDLPHPISEYGRSKWAGEVLAQRVYPDVVIARVQGLYGRGGKNFSSKLRALVADKKAITVDGERQVQPTWARAAARQIVKVLDHRARAATYHVSCGGAGTWADFAAHLTTRLGIEGAWRTVRTADIPAAAARPKQSLLSRRMLQLHGIDVMPDWRAALDEYFDEETAITQGSRS